MANLAQIAGSYSFQLVGQPQLADSPLWSTVAGVVWIIVMAYICYRGIEISARLQYALLSIGVLVLVAFSVIALVKVNTGNATPDSVSPSLDWFVPSGLSLSALVTATLIAVFFIYWGWDTAVSVNEETSNPEKTPGRAAIISTLLLLVTYAIVSVATVAFAGTGESGLGLANPDNSDDVFRALGPQVFGSSTIGAVLEALVLLSVLTSAAASTQTTILPTARTALAMGAYKAIPGSFARIHPRYMTPSVATVWMGAVSIVFYVGLTLVSQNVLGDSIAAVGLMIAFYYGLTGFAAAWFYRRDIFRSGRNFFMKGLFPFLGGLMLLGAFVIASVQYAQPTYGSTAIGGVGGVFIIGIGTLLLGVALMFVWNIIAPAFFRGEVLPKRTSSDLVLATPHQEETLRLPDSGLPDIVIAPDLSNLPQGAQALDLESGKEIADDAGLRSLRED